MECAIKPPPKPSNISDIVFKFAKVCKLRSMGVFSSDNNANTTENSSIATEETECEGGKVHPVIVEIQSKTNQSDDVDISKLFDTISAIKLAYIQLQEAHVPYDPDKITAANELIVAQFSELYKIKHIFKAKQLKDVNLVSRLDEIQAQEKLLEKLRFQVKEKNTRIFYLRQKLADLELLNREMVEKIEKKYEIIENLVDMSSFGEIVMVAAGAIHDFAKPLISLMKASGWDLDQAVNSIESSVVYAKRSHKKYAFEAYIARKMFSDIPSKPSNIDSTICNDPFGDLITHPNSIFAKFCQTKYLDIVHPMMEASFFGNLDHRTLVSSGKHPKTQFYEAFVKMSWRIWVLQGVAFSSEPKAEMFGVKRCAEFDKVYMESMVDLDKEMAVSSEKVPRFKVEFTVMPGFKIGNTLVKSRVYLSTVRS